MNDFLQDAKALVEQANDNTLSQLEDQIKVLEGQLELLEALRAAVLVRLGRVKQPKKVDDVEEIFRTAYIVGRTLKLKPKEPESPKVDPNESWMLPPLPIALPPVALPEPPEYVPHHRSRGIKEAVFNCLANGEALSVAEMAGRCDLTTTQVSNVIGTYRESFTKKGFRKWMLSKYCSEYDVNQIAKNHHANVCT